MGFKNTNGIGSTLVADNVDFSGVGIGLAAPTVTTNGQLLIGATATPHIRVGNLTSTGASITITNGAGTINLETATATPTTFTEDSGSATPAANNLNIFGTSAQGISTSGAGSTVTLTAANATSSQKGVASFNGTEFTVTSGAVASNPITVTAGSGITVTGSPVNLGGTVTIAATAAVPLLFTEDTGTAAPLANNLNILGTAAQGISTSGSGATVTLTAANATSAQKGVASFNGTEFTVTSGAVASNPITLTAGTGISISGSPVNLGGTATISAVGVGIVWNDIASNTSGVINNGYFATGSLTLSLPAAPGQGGMIELAADTASVVTIQANTGQTIRLGNATSTSGGTAATTKQGDSVRLVFRLADTTWFGVSSVGNFTLA